MLLQSFGTFFSFQRLNLNFLDWSFYAQITDQWPHQIVIIFELVLVGFYTQIICFYWHIFCYKMYRQNQIWEPSSNKLRKYSVSKIGLTLHCTALGKLFLVCNLILKIWGLQSQIFIIYTFSQSEIEKKNACTLIDPWFSARCCHFTISWMAQTNSNKLYLKFEPMIFLCSEK